MTEKPGRRLGWADLLITSGLAATVGALGSLATTELLRENQAAATKRCEIAAGVLQDETPSPYMDREMQKRTTAAAAGRFERCMKE